MKYILIVLLIIFFPIISFAEDASFAGIVVKVIPPSLVTPPYCPFRSIIVAGSHPGWFAVMPISYSKIFPFFNLVTYSLNRYVIGSAAKTPCGLVPGIVKIIAASP